jgi:hypothetical protein
VRPGGGEEKKVPRKKPTWAEERRKKKGQLEFATLVRLAQGQGGTKKVHPSIHIGALVGASSLWPSWST